MSNARHTKLDHRLASVTVREANGADAGALARLAALDSSRAPAQPALLAEVNGEARAAISIADGAVVADPFHRTDELVAMLRLHTGHDADGAPAPRALGHSLWQRRPRPSTPSVPGLPAIPS